MRSEAQRKALRIRGFYYLFHNYRSVTVVAQSTSCTLVYKHGKMSIGSQLGSLIGVDKSGC